MEFEVAYFNQSLDEEKEGEKKGKRKCGEVFISEVW